MRGFSRLFDFRFFSADDKCSAALFGDYVRARSADKRQKTGRSFLAAGKGYLRLQNALFACRNGKIRVGRKGYARQFAVGGIVLDARRAFFFVATRYKPHATVQPYMLL